MPEALRARVRVATLAAETEAVVDWPSRASTCRAGCGQADGKLRQSVLPVLRQDLDAAKKISSS
jgi:hypothetical protein